MDDLKNIAPVMNDIELFLTVVRHASAINLFMSIYPDKLRQEQETDFVPNRQYLCDNRAALPRRETAGAMSSSPPEKFWKLSTFQDQLVIPQAFIKLVLYLVHACHDHALPGGHLAFEPNLDKS